MRIVHSALLCVCIAISTPACTSLVYQPLQPIQPAFQGRSAAANLVRGKEVELDTLRPTFEWKPYGEECTYELAVYRNAGGQPGPQVYRRADILGTAHQIATDLQRDTGYYWTVRAHCSTETTPWMEYEAYSGFEKKRTWGFIPFRTPKE